MLDAARPRSARRRRVRLLAWAAVLLVAGAGLASRAAEAGWAEALSRAAEAGWAEALSPFAGAVLWPVLLAYPAWRVATGPRRAIERNSGPPSS
ncbi:hypothetical protein ACI780_15070 [Geodermatophilus sp. SYSU D00814]